jgi:hypothetical protein
MYRKKVALIGVVESSSKRLNPVLVTRSGHDYSSIYSMPLIIEQCWFTADHRRPFAITVYCTYTVKKNLTANVSFSIYVRSRPCFPDYK